MKPGSRLLAVLVAAVCIVVTVVHWPALRAQALYIDDSEYLLNNPLVQNPSLAAAGRFLSEVTAPSTVPGYYQPLAMISLMLDTALGGGPKDLAAYHRTSLALHVGNTALVIVLLYLLFHEPWIAAFAGLLFGVHPIAVESIPWITDRKTPLATFFALWSLVAYLRYTGRADTKWYIIALAFYMLGLMSKPTITPLPVLMLLLDYWPLRRLSRRSLLEKVPFVLVAVASSIITIISQGRTCGVSGPGESPVSRIVFLVCHNIVFYLHTILWPAGLTWYYSFPSPFVLSHPAVLIGVIGTVALLVILVLSLKWTPSLLVGWLFFVIAIFPTLGILTFTSTIAANRFAYFPMLGILIPISWLLNRLWNLAVYRRALRVAVVAVVVLAAAGEGFASRYYLALWRDNFALDNYLLKTSDNKPFFYNQLGNAYKDRGELDQAVQTYLLALAEKPDYPATYYNLANVLLVMNRLPEATRYGREAVRLDPGNFDAQVNLCIILARHGDHAEAVAHGEQAVRLKPNFPLAHYNLGLALAGERDYDRAIREFERTIALAPNYAPAWHNLVVACYLRKDYARAAHAVDEMQTRRLPMKFPRRMLEEIRQRAASAR